MAYKVYVLADLTGVPSNYTDYCKGVASGIAETLRSNSYETVWNSFSTNITGALPAEKDRTLSKVTNDIKAFDSNLVVVIKVNTNLNKNMLYLQHESNEEKKLAESIKKAFPNNIIINIAKGNSIPYSGNIPIIKFAPDLLGDDFLTFNKHNKLRPASTDAGYLAQGILNYFGDTGIKSNEQEAQEAVQSSGQLSEEPSYSLMDTDNISVDIDFGASTFTKPTVAGSIDRIYGETLPKIYEKQLTIHSDYLVYFDNILMNDYVLSYTTNVGIRVGIGSASVELVYTPAFRSIGIGGDTSDGIENGTQLRIFMSNVFSGKYKMVFDGIIKQRMLSRDESGFRLNFTAVDYVYWMNKITAPISIPFNQAISPGERLKWKAQSVDPDKTANVVTAKAGSLKGKNVQEYFDTLKEKAFTNSNICSDSNSVINWDDTINRVEIMGDINKELTKYQVIDFIINSNAVFADTVYVSMSNTANNLMMEFYQDRDGIIRIKPPFWNEPVLKTHVVDSMMIISSSETTDWTKMYTRIIVTGGVEEWMPESGSSSSKVDLLTPVGVYLGSLTDKGQAKWADYTSEGVTPSSYGVVTVDDGTGGSSGSSSSGSQAAGQGTPTGWIYPMKKKATCPIAGASRHFGADRSGRKHAGVDLIQEPGVAVVACTSGEVKEVDGNYYAGTGMIFVRNDDGFWINYGEVKPAVSVGQKINKGQVIGTTIRNNSGGSCMIHFEVYQGDFTGAAGYNEGKVNSGFLHVKDQPFARRNDLIDPAFVENLPLG